MAVTESVQDFQLIKCGKNGHTPDHSQELPDCTSVYASDHSSENPSDLSTLADRLWAVGELAERYECSDRTIQKMMKFVREAYPMAQLKDRQGKRSMYTSLCVQYLDSLHKAKQQGIDSPQWVQSQKEAPQTPSFSGPEENSSISPPSLVSGESGGQLAVSTGVVPSEIELATDQQHSMLDSAIARFARPHLNGQQESNLAGIELLIEATDQATAMNDQRQSALDDREATVEKSEEVLELVRDRLQAEQQRSKSLNRQETEVAEREQAVNELLGKLGISPQS